MRNFGKVYKYKNHFITITKKKDSYYTANYTINGKEYYSGNSDVDKILKYFRSNVDKLMEKNMKELTYGDVCKEWESHYKIVNYKNRQLRIEVISHPKLKDLRPFYIGYASIYPRYSYSKDSKSFESIHYDKVVSRFQRFVDEYCTDWVVKAILQYKGYEIKISREAGCKEFYLGIVQFHKNSTFKHIADTREEVERCCRNRIDKVIYEKEKFSKLNKIMAKLDNGARKHKIQELEQLQARISAQLEELKKEKDTLTYKGVVLEYGVEEDLAEGWMIGSIKNAPGYAKNVYGKSVPQIKQEFEEYVDELEKSHYIYSMIRLEIKNRY